MNPFFSVIIPTYNRAKELKRAVESVLVQSFIDYEILVMDDGSTDKTKDVVSAFDDQRIRYEWAVNSGGPATPRNRGIDAASGDWICFLDADDLWYPNKLTKVYESIKSNPEKDLLCHDEMLAVKGSERKELLKHGPYEKDFYQVMLIEGNRISTSATSVRRAFLKKHALRFNQSADYVIVEDYDMWLRIAFYDGQFIFIDDILGEYIIEEKNISLNREKLFHNLKVLLKDHVFLLQTFDSNKDQLWAKIIARMLLSDVKESIKKKKYITGLYSLCLAFKSSPIGVLSYTYSLIKW